VVVVVPIVVLVDGESPPVVTLGFDEEHPAPSKARATMPAASRARRRGSRRWDEWDGCGVVNVTLVMTITTSGSRVRFTRDRC